MRTNNTPENPTAPSLMGLITHVNTWKKALLTVFLLVALSLLRGAWEARRELAYMALDAFGAPRIDAAALRDTLPALMRETGAVSLSAWSVNLQRNQRIALYVNAAGVEDTGLAGTSDMALRPDLPHSRQMIRMLTTQTACYPHADPSPVGQADTRAGATWFCAASIPPRAGLFIGVLVAGFKSRPANEDYIRHRLALTAEQIIH